MLRSSRNVLRCGRHWQGQSIASGRYFLASVCAVCGYASGVLEHRYTRCLDMCVAYCLQFTAQHNNDNNHNASSKRNETRACRACARRVHSPFKSFLGNRPAVPLDRPTQVSVMQLSASAITYGIGDRRISECVREEESKWNAKRNSKLIVVQSLHTAAESHESTHEARVSHICAILCATV